MTLQSIKIPPFVIGNLYKNCLVDLQSGGREPLEQNEKINFLGNNERQILLLVNNFDVPFLPDNELDFLLGILAACKLNMADIAIVNLDRTEPAEHKSLPEFFRAEVVMLFGIEATALNLPFKIPHFQVQLFKDKRYLFAPELIILQSDVSQKRKLWEALKNIFSI